MQKAFHWMQNLTKRQKRLLYILVCAVVLAAVAVSTLSYYSGCSTISGNGRAEVQVGEICEGEEVRQSLSVKDPIQSVSIRFDAYARENSGTVDIQVIGRDSGTVYCHEQMDAAEIEDSDLIEFVLSEEANPEVDSSIDIVVTADSVPGKAITIWSSQTSVIKDGELTVNGTVMPGDMTVQIACRGKTTLLQFALYNVMVSAALLLLLWITRAFWKRQLLRLRAFISRNRSRLGFRLLLLCLPAAVSLIIWGVWFADRSVNTFLFFLFAGLAVGALIAGREWAKDHPERLFLAVILCVGFSFTSLLPTAPIVSWDDQTHYERVLGIAYAWHPILTDADEAICYLQEENFNNHPGYEGYLQNQGLNELNTQGLVHTSVGWSDPIIAISYLPSILGIWLGRLFQLPFTVTFFMGRALNLVCYAVVFYLAIKRMKQGGMLLAVFAMIPTALFLACNYAYDPFCIAFLALGTAIFVDECRHAERKITWKTAAELYVCMALGCAAKRIYFPIYLICLFLPKEKFTSNAHRKKYCIVTVAVMLAVIVSFAAPYLFSAFTGTMTGDSRGGADVNATAQVQQMLQDPISYMKVLFRYLFGTYLQPSVIYRDAIGFWAYLPMYGVGRFPYCRVVIALLAITFFVEYPRDNTLRKPSILAKLSSVVMFMACVMLAATALYISFTPVGADTVAGCQERYLLPVLLPMLMLIRPFRIHNPIPVKYYNWTVLAVETGIWFVGLWPLLSSYVIERT